MFRKSPIKQQRNEFTELKHIDIIIKTTLILCFLKVETHYTLLFEIVFYSLFIIPCTHVEALAEIRLIGSTTTPFSGYLSFKHCKYGSVSTLILLLCLCDDLLNNISMLNDVSTLLSDKLRVC